MLSRLFRENVALSVSAILVLVAGFRIYAFTNFDVPNALAVLSVVDYFKLLFSSLVSALSAFIPYVFLLFVFDTDVRHWILGKGAASEHILQLRSAVIFGPLLLFGVITLTNFMALIFILFFASYAAIQLAKKRKLKRGDRTGRRAGKTSWRRDVSLISLATPLVFSSVIFAPWTPLEAIQIRGEADTVHGYVIGETGAHTLIVLKHKTPHWITTDDVEARQLCQGDAYWTEKLALVSLMELFGSKVLADQSLSKDLCGGLDSQ
ncbi:MAG: hypothetical protein WBX27_07100 [Specibacter sp.]